LNRFNIGAEKTFLGGRASIYVRIPFLDATNNTSGLPISGLGDVSAGLKCALVDKKTGSALTAGMTVSAPTAHDQVLVTSVANGASASLTPFSSTSTITVNPTFLQPWFAGLLVLDRLYVQDYLGFVLPTDTRVPPILNNDFGVGYQVYRGSPGQFLRFVRPTIDVQVLQPFNQPSGAGSAPFPVPIPNATFNGVFGFPTQVFMSEGMQLGLGNRFLLSTAVVTPLAGPKAFTIGATFGINFFF
jgi:hypothetical protein